MIPEKVADWLIEPENPSVRYRTIAEILIDLETMLQFMTARVKLYHQFQ